MSFGSWLAEITVPGAAALTAPAMGNIRALLDGTIAFTEGGPAGVVGNWGILNPSSGAVVEIAAPVASTMGGICDTGDGRVAYSLSSAHTCVVCNRDGSGSHSIDIGPAAGAGEVILGPDGRIWGAGYNSGVRVVDLAGALTVGAYVAGVYTAGSTTATGATPHSITVGSDGRLYVSCIGADALSAIVSTGGTAGTVTTYTPAAKYSLNPAGGSVQTCRANPIDGKIYFARGPARCTLARMSTAGVFDPEWAVQTAFGTPAGTIIDAAGNIWVSMRSGNKVECYSVTGQRLASVTCPTVGGNPNKLAYANGLVYAAYFNAGKIGVIQAV